MIKKCSICEQKMDMYTTSHKNLPFVDGRLYPAVCFTCFFIPKIMNQTYDEKGNIFEEVELDYSCSNLNTAEEVYNQGAAETLNQAKKSLESVKKVCESAIGSKKQKSRPIASWNMC